ncbi:hypothetical protein ABBQ38_008137 [Trebouxia sp. C0009 RCD-2024]
MYTPSPASDNGVWMWRRMVLPSEAELQNVVAADEVNKPTSSFHSAEVTKLFLNAGLRQMSPLKPFPVRITDAWIQCYPARPSPIAPSPSLLCSIGVQDNQVLVATHGCKRYGCGLEFQEHAHHDDRGSIQSFFKEGLDAAHVCMVVLVPHIWMVWGMAWSHASLARWGRETLRFQGIQVQCQLM